MMSLRPGRAWLLGIVLACGGGSTEGTAPTTSTSLSLLPSTTVPVTTTSATTSTTLPLLDYPPSVVPPQNLETCFTDDTTDTDYGCVVTTLLGGAESSFGDGGPANLAELGSPAEVLVHGDLVYIADGRNDRIRVVDAAGRIRTVAGGGSVLPLVSDGALATDISIASPKAMTIGPDGLFYFAPFKTHIVLRIETDGTITRIAGGSLVDGQYAGDIGDGRSALDAELNHPTDLVFGLDGNLYISTSDHRIRRVDANGIITTVAGTGEHGTSGDGGPAAEATLGNVEGMALDPSGRIHLAEGSGARILDPATGQIESSDRFDLTGATDVAVSADGYIYFSFRGANKVVRIPLADYLDEVPPLVDLSDCSQHNRTLGGRFWVSTSGSARLWADVDECGHFLLEVTPGDYRIEFWTIGEGDIPGFEQLGWFGSPNQALATGEVDATVIQARPGGAHAIEALLPDITNPVTGLLIVEQTWEAEVVAGTGDAGYSGDNGQATEATFNGPGSIGLAHDGILYIADEYNGAVRTVDGSGLVRTFAGGIAPSIVATDRVPFDGTPFNRSAGATYDAFGNLYFIDFDFSIIRRVDTHGYVSRVAGTGRPAFSHGPTYPLKAALDYPGGPVFDHHGNLFFIEWSVVRRITPGADGVVDGSPDEVLSTVVGLPGAYEEMWGSCLESDCTSRGFHTVSDDVVASQAVLQDIRGIAFDSRGNLWIVDWRDHRLLRVSPGADGVISGADDEIMEVIAGDGHPGTAGEGGPAAAARLNHPIAIAIDSQDNVYMHEHGMIRRYMARTGVIERFVDVGGAIVIDRNDNVYLTDTQKVYRIDSTGRITHIGGIGTGGWSDSPGGFSGDGEDARYAEFAYMDSLTLTPDGHLLVADIWNDRLRQITFIPLE